MSCTHTVTECQKTVVIPTPTTVPDEEHKPPKDDSNFSKCTTFKRICCDFRPKLKWSDTFSKIKTNSRIVAEIEMEQYIFEKKIPES